MAAALGFNSLTLAASTLDIVRVPTAPVEVVITLSIVFLGVKIVRQRRGETSVTIEHPWVAAFGFGLVHGLGFASALSTLGLADGEILLALLLFNVGVQIGQLAFVAVCLAFHLALHSGLRRLNLTWPRWAEAVPAYVVGSLGAFWTIAQLTRLVAHEQRGWL